MFSASSAYCRQICRLYYARLSVCDREEGNFIFICFSQGIIGDIVSHLMESKISLVVYHILAVTAFQSAAVHLMSVGHGGIISGKGNCTLSMTIYVF